MRSAKNIQLDLNNPVFLDSWFALETTEAERVRSAFEKIYKLPWSDFYKSKGFKWAKVDSIPLPGGVDSLNTFLLTDSVSKCWWNIQ